VGRELTTAVYAMARAERLLTATLEEMTLPQLRVLRLISKSPERASAIAEQAAVSRPSLTGVLDGLEARGWIRRAEVSGDRRGVRLEATAEGLAALEAEEATLTARLDEVLATLDADERATVIAGLSGFAEALDRWNLARRGEAPR
jgi:MarR family transcriptional repressor of mepA